MHMLTKIWKKGLEVSWGEKEKAYLSPLSSTFFIVEVVSLLDTADPY